MGVCYGMLGNLPTLQDVRPLPLQPAQHQEVAALRPGRSALQALAGSGIELMLGILDEDLERINSDQVNADAWIHDNVINHGDVTFRYIAVGNEVQPTDYSAWFLVPAMYNIWTALANAGLADRVKVSTAIDARSLAKSYPPSEGAFKQEYLPILEPLARFLKESGSPLLINIYPYLSYYYNQDIHLEYALFTSPSVVFTDLGFNYQNLFYAIFDSMVVALDKIGAGSLGMVVLETGWSTGGGTVALIHNAQTYNTNLVRHVRNGTPRRPGPLETYTFVMFDVDRKTGEEFEKYWGLFTLDKQLKYPIDFS